MKTSERHQLKTNDFAAMVLRVQDLLASRQREIVGGVLAGLLIVVGLGAYTVWRSQSSARADTALAEALALAEAPVGAAAMMGEGQAFFATTTDRQQAVVERLLAVADAHPSRPAGIAARYQAGGRLLDLGRAADARAAFERVESLAGRGSVYLPMARLGLAEAHVLEGNYDAAIQIFREVAARPDSDVPADGLLMHLGRTYLAAGRMAEALQSFQRVLDEHPQSVFAAEARREAEAARVAGGGA